MKVRKQLGMKSLVATVLVGAGTAWAGPPAVVINELDADQTGTDMAEFVELYDGGAGSTDLSGLVVVFYNGSSDTSYAAFDLDGFSTDGAGYFLLGNAGVVPTPDIIFADNFLQNGADAVALYVGNDSDFPNGTPITAVGLLDCIVYGTNDPDDAGLIAVCGGPQNDDTVDTSIGRIPNGSGARDEREHSHARRRQRAGTPTEQRLPRPDRGVRRGQSLRHDRLDAGHDRAGAGRCQHGYGRLVQLHRHVHGHRGHRHVRRHVGSGHRPRGLRRVRLRSRHVHPGRRR